MCLVMLMWLTLSMHALPSVVVGNMSERDPPEFKQFGP